VRQKYRFLKKKIKHNEVEVYFENTKIGGLSIRVIIGIQVDDV
jgi:NADPH-dependent 7-cyano-7-deazaguanine reductase QueF